MLATIWLASSERDAVTRAAALIDRELERHPLTFGESRESSVHRVAFIHPIGIEYEIIEDDKKVIVQGVWAV
jgi:hypothetical protein